MTNTKQLIQFVNILIFSIILQTSFAFSAEDVESLRNKIDQLKEKSSQTEIEALKKELNELKIKRLEDKIEAAEKRLDDKLETKSDVLDAKIQQSKGSNTLFLNEKIFSEKSSPTSEVKKARSFALHIASGLTSLKPTSGGDSLYLYGTSLGISYEKNRFFAELLGTSMSGKTEAHNTNPYLNHYYYSCYYYNECNSPSYTISTKMQSVDFKLGYKFGGNIVKFEPYVGIGRTSASISRDTNHTNYYYFKDSSTSFTQFTPGARLSIGSSSVRTYLDIATPYVISKEKNYDEFGYEQGTIAKIGLSFAF